MRSYLAVMLAALVSTVCLTPLARRLALAIGAVGSVGGRNVHARSIPRLGGLASTVGSCVTVLVFLKVGGFPAAVLSGSRSQLFGGIVGGLLLCAIGAVDDVRGVRASRKLMAHVLVAALAYWCGFRIEAIALPFGGTLAMGAFALPVTTLWIVGITNAVNLIDGLDGLAAGVAFFAALTSFVVAYLGGNPFVALTSAALMGVLAGFLFFNFNPARIFMGDSGSYFLGYTLATLSLTGSLQQKASTAVSLLVPMIALGLPIFDTALTMFRRFLERRSLFSPDRGHIHHRLLDLGLTHRRAVVSLYGVCIVFTASAIAVSLGRTWQTGVALFCVSTVCIALVRFGGYFEYRHLLRRQTTRMYDPNAEKLRHAVPQALRDLGPAMDEHDLLDWLRIRAIECGLDRIELESMEGQPLHMIEPQPGDSATRDTLQSTYPIGHDTTARARVRFVFRADQADLSPQVAILLQLLVDAFAQALGRAGSNLAPERSGALDSERPGQPLPLPTSSV